MKDKLLIAVRYLLERFQEPSSIRGVVWLLCGGFVGFNVEDPNSMEGIIALSMLVAGLLGVLLPEKK